MRTIAWVELSHVSKVESPSTNNCPAQRRAWRPVKSTPRHRLAPDVRPLEATVRKSSVAPEANCVVAFNAWTATPVVCSERSAAAPIMRATCITGPCCPLKIVAMPKHMNKVPPNIVPNLGKRTLGKDRPFLRAPHEAATALPLSFAVDPVLTLVAGRWLDRGTTGGLGSISSRSWPSRHLRLW